MIRASLRIHSQVSISTASFLDQVRDSCEWVAQRSRHVQVNRDAIGPYAAAFPAEAFAAPKLDPKHHYLTDVEGAVAFIFTLDTINFGSGYWPILQKRPGRLHVHAAGVENFLPWIRPAQDQVGQEHAGNGAVSHAMS